MPTGNGLKAREEGGGGHVPLPRLDGGRREWQVGEGERGRRGGGGGEGRNVRKGRQERDWRSKRIHSLEE